ncbi:uncharacterized protein LOC141609399 [Silene latifolia]|uniref:uncharacterized protein LOC141609399 n=1 Tax=Silene latifolia TaxID=37657 RepID=UPI003D7829B7
MTMGSYEYDGVSSVSSIDSLECRSKQEAREIPQKNKTKIETYWEMRKKESKRKLEEWEETSSAITGLLDTTGASILEVDGCKLKLNKPELYSRLTRLLWQCRWKSCLSYFTHPGGDESDGGMVAIENSPTLTKKTNKLYSSKAFIAIKQYNNNINNQQSSKLEFCSFIRVAYSYGCELYITFTACQNGQLGTFQAVVDDDWDWDEDVNVNLVLLRHLEADKIIAIMSLSGAEEEWKKIFG